MHIHRKVLSALAILPRWFYILSTGVSLSAFSQIAESIVPLSEVMELPAVPWVELPVPDVQKLRAEDAVTDSYKDIPWRFGEPIPVQFNLLNSGLWYVENGYAVWRLGVKARKAVSINVNYSQFYLPEGASFYVYSPDKKQRLGAFTARNHNPDGRFATAFIYGDEIIFELNVPYAHYHEASIEISEIVYGYRGIEEWLKNYGDAGGCNVNVICDSATWYPEMRSVVMLLTAGNARFCSGVLLNNVLQDGKPYVLTANHCGVATNNIFMFNYRSPLCAPSSDGNTSYTIQGCEIKAYSSYSDFVLVLLSQVPPLSYNVVYAGWSAEGDLPLESTGIHHPMGDVAKISHNYDTVKSSGYYALGNSHWKVNNWETGTTEAGSSGSPLFDEYHRVVGQLHGGNAACNNSNYQDYYGKFSLSWDYYADSTQQLKYWLDPQNTGQMSVSAYDPNASLHPLDLVILSMHGADPLACNVISAPLYCIVRNMGNQPITAAKLKVFVNGSYVTTLQPSFSSLNYLHTDTVHIPFSLPLMGGLNEITVEITEVNGTTDYVANNLFTKTVFYNNVPFSLMAMVKTDNYGSELYWHIEDMQGNVIYKNGPYEDVNGGQTFQHSVCLWEGCFRLVLEDSYGDGYCCAYGNGSMLLQQGNDTIFFNQTFNTGQLIYDFCVGDSCHLFLTGKVTLPNPVNGAIDLMVYGGSGNYIYAWSNGSSSEDLTGLSAGNYSVVVQDLTLGCVDSLTFVLGINGKDNFAENISDILLYPNPSYGGFSIKSLGQIASVRIYDISGKQVWGEESVYSAHYTYTRDIASGMYLIQVITVSGTVKFYRWIKQ